MKYTLFSTFAVLVAASVRSYGFDIAIPGTEGFPVIASGGVVIATYQGNSAGYSNDLYLERNALGDPAIDGDQSNDLFIFNNHANNEGDTLNLGTFASGTELVFRLHVNNTGDDFFSGDPLRNPDDLAHARVEANWLPATTLVSFEDLLNTPEGVNGYNDLSFSFENTETRIVPTPDAGSTLFLLGLAIPGMFSAARRLNRKS